MHSEQFEFHSQLLKALAHPRRLAIIYLLRDQDLSVSRMCKLLNFPQANMSQHLMILREAGIVATNKKGKQIIYKLVKKKILEISNFLSP